MNKEENANQLNMFGEEENWEEVLEEEPASARESEDTEEAEKDRDQDGPDPDRKEETIETKEERMIQAPSGEWFSETEWHEPVFYEGPTRQEVEEWKDKYGNVYFVPFGEDVFIFRTLNREEYKMFISDSNLSMLDREEKVTDNCVLYPRNFQVGKVKKGQAGVPSTLSEMIMDKSGFVAQSAPIPL